MKRGVKLEKNEHEMNTVNTCKMTFNRIMDKHWQKQKHSRTIKMHVGVKGKCAKTDDKTEIDGIVLGWSISI